MHTLTNSTSPKLPSKTFSSFFPNPTINNNIVPQVFSTRSKMPYETKYEGFHSLASQIQAQFPSSTTTKKLSGCAFKEDQCTTNRADRKETDTRASFPLDNPFMKPIRDTSKPEKKKALKMPARKAAVTAEKKTKEERGQQESIYDYLMKQKNRLIPDTKDKNEKKLQHARSVSINAMKKADYPTRDSEDENHNEEHLETSSGQSRQHERSTATSIMSSRSLEMTPGDEDDNVLSLARQKEQSPNYSFKPTNESPESNKECREFDCWSKTGQDSTASKKRCETQTSSINISSLMFEGGESDVRSRPATVAPTSGHSRETRSYEGRESLELKKAKNIFGTSEETRKRKKELLGLHQKIAKQIEEMSYLGGSLHEEKKNLHKDIQKIEEGIEQFTEETIKALQRHKEAYLNSLNEHFNKDLRRMDQFSRNLESYSAEFFNIKEDVEVNFYKIIAISDQRLFTTIMNEYSQKITDLSNLNDKIKESTIQARFPAWEELTYFKKTLKNLLGETVKETGLEARRCEQIVTDSPNVPEKKKTKSKDLTAQAKRDIHRQISLDNKRERSNSPVLISFENKEIFENAMQTANDIVSVVNSMQDTNRNAYFRTESDESSSPNATNERTPRLKFELREQPSGEVREFKEEADKEKLRKGAQDSEISKLNCFTKALIGIGINRNEVVRDSKARRVKTEYDEEANFVSYLGEKKVDCKAGSMFQNPFMCPPTKMNGQERKEMFC